MWSKMWNNLLVSGNNEKLCACFAAQMYSMQYFDKWPHQSVTVLDMAFCCVFHSTRLKENWFLHWYISQGDFHVIIVYCHGKIPESTTFFPSVVHWNYNGSKLGLYVFCSRVWRLVCRYYCLFLLFDGIHANCCTADKNKKKMWVITKAAVDDLKMRDQIFAVIMPALETCLS